MKQNKEGRVTELYLFIIILAFVSYGFSHLISKGLKKFFEFEVNIVFTTLAVFFSVFAFLYVLSEIQEYKDNKKLKLNK